MKRYLLTILICYIAFPAASSQQTSTTALTDSTAYVSEADSTVVHQLEEFVVEGRSALVGKEGIVFMPNSTEVKHADNAYSLIENMGIPFLKSNGVNIQSTIGANPDVFVDYHKASQEELLALRPEDVQVVEFLLFPADVRFMGAKAVLNFIMKPRDDGGYVKAEALQTFLRPGGKYSLYGKYVKGNWAFDLFTEFNYSDSEDHTVTETTYSGFDKLNPDYSPSITRKHEVNGKSKKHSSSSGFRFKYTSFDFSISNKLNLYYTKTPKRIDSGFISYSPAIFAPTASATSLNSENLRPSWDMNIYIRANDKLSFSINAYMDYEHYLRHNTLTTDEFAPIQSDIKYDTYYEQLSFYTNYRLNTNNRFSFSLGGYASQNDTKYGGSVVANPEQRIRTAGGNTGLSWTHERDNGLRFSLGAYTNYTHNSVNNQGHGAWRPRANADLYFPIDQKQFISLTGSYETLTPGSYSQQDVLYQVNEILWSTVDAPRKTGYAYQFNLGYSNTLTDKFSFSASTFYDQRSSMQAFHFTPVEAYKVIRSNDFNGKYRSVFFYLSGTLKLLDNSWHISGDANYSFSQYFGSLNKIFRHFGASVSTHYFLKDFSFGASFSTPGLNSTMSAEIYEMSGCSYGLTCGYSHNNLHVDVGVYNIFRKRGYATTYYVTDNYSNKSKQMSGQFGSSTRCVSVTVNYTLEFGKKVNKWDEIR